MHSDCAGFFEETLGKTGIRRPELLALAPRLRALAKRLRAGGATSDCGFFSLPFAPGTDALQARARALARRFRRTLVFGIGGASLGGEMLVRALGRGDAAGAIRFSDNIDPRAFAQALPPRWGDALLLVISKSGETAETLGQFLSVLPQLEAELGPDGLREQVLVITENPHGALFQLARELRLEVLPHPPVGGRFSVLSVVGLLPAAIAGVDIAALLAGARRMAERCAAPELEQNPAFWNATAQYLHAERGRNVSVYLGYGDHLRAVLRWLCQLWGESLGKRAADGRSRGLTPVAARGVTDQHSQLQLYLDGPDDKQFSFVVSPELRAAGGPRTVVPQRFRDIPAAALLAGHGLGELFMAEFEATRATLTRHGRPNRTLSLALDDPAALGELIMLLQVETVAMAELLGVNPFDQPAVEEGKRLAREYLEK